jgi:ectoine hydroxylase-related dioxygenase (phytanoyl-CoA dioxygenase family)
VLTADQRAEFEERGLTRLRNVFTSDDAARMRLVVWRELERRYGVVEDDRSTWKLGAAHGMKTSKKSRAFEPIGGPVLLEVIDELLGVGTWTTAAHWGQVMVTFPQPDGAWTLPSKLWHVDWHYTHAPTPLFGVKMFAFFGTVDPQGGGTLVVPGSHRVVERFVASTEQDVRTDFRTCRLRFMRHDPWFRALSRTDDADPERVARFMGTDHDCDGIPVRVVELTGDPGDVVLTHPWMLHHVAPNTSSYPRMMRGKTYNRRS